MAFAFPYGRCPKCGGQLSLSQSSLDPSPDTAAVAAVRTAFEIELGGRAFYQRAAVEATDDSTRSLFRRFAAMGIALAEGREFNDGAAGEIIVNLEFARAQWPDGRALGRAVRVGPAGLPMTVVGVTRMTRTPMCFANVSMT